jgi:hypothetical protein
MVNVSRENIHNRKQHTPEAEGIGRIEGDRHFCAWKGWMRSKIVGLPSGEVGGHVVAPLTVRNTRHQPVHRTWRCLSDDNHSLVRLLHHLR